MTIEQKEFVHMLDKKGLLPECHYSTVTEKFYWTSKLEVKDGCMLTSIVEHRESPEEALDAYRDRLQGKDLIADFEDGRREYIVLF